jgi:hypothetical protein
MLRDGLTAAIPVNLGSADCKPIEAMSSENAEEPYSSSSTFIDVHGAREIFRLDLMF